MHRHSCAKRLAAGLLAAASAGTMVFSTFSVQTFAGQDSLQLRDGNFTVTLDGKLPVVQQYAVGENQLTANTKADPQFIVNGQQSDPVKTDVRVVGEHKAVYTLVFEDKAELTVELSAQKNEYGGILEMRYLDIDENIETFEIRGQGLLAADSADKVTYNKMYYREDTIEQPGDQVGGKDNIGHFFLSDEEAGLAASMETSLFGQSICSLPQDGETLFSSNAHIIRGRDGEFTEDPWVKVVVTRDRNADYAVDWQDAAVAYREIMDEMPGEQMLARQSTYVQVALNYRNKFPRPYEQVLDDAKRLANATDGFPQIIEVKNAHDGFDGWPSYGDAAYALGGDNALNWLIEEGKEQGIFFGLHTNSNETYPESPRHTQLNEYDIARHEETGSWADSIITRDANGNITWDGGWKCMDLQTSKLNESNYYKSGLLQQFYQEHSDAFPQLGFQYLDIQTGNDSWSGLMTVKQFRDHGWNLFGEYASGSVDHTYTAPTRGAKYMQWTHNFGADANSALRRFVMNDVTITGNTKGGGEIADIDKVLGFGDTTKNNMWGAHGWANNNSQETLEEQIDIFWRQILPDTFLKNYRILGFTRDGNDMTAHFEGDENNRVRVEWHDSEGLRYIYKNDILIAKVSRGDFNVVGHAYSNPRYTATDSAQLFIPYADEPQEYEYPAYREDIIYTHSDKAGQTTWELPDSWKNLQTVVLYRLDETEGRCDPQQITVENGTVSIDYKDTVNGYVLCKGEEASQPTVWGDSNGSRMHVRDFEFNSMLGEDTPWTLEGNAAVEQQPEKRLIYSPADQWLNTEPSTGYSGTPSEVDTSNRYLRFSDEQRASVQQTIEGLIPGATYAFVAFVDVQNQAGETKTAQLQVSDSDGANAVSVSSQPYRIGTTNYERLNGWEMIRVYYTAPADGRAIVTITGTEGAGDVRVDCVRDYIEQSPYGRNGYYYQDTFEGDHWLGGFVHARYNESQGQTLTKESKYAGDVIYTLPDGTKTLQPTQEILEDGVTEHSFKLRPPAGSGAIVNSLPGLMKLESNAVYKFTMDYTSEAGSGDCDWTLELYSPSAGKVLHTISLQAKQGEVQTVTDIISVGEYEDCIFRFSGGKGDLIVDNFSLGSAEDIVQYTVTASCGEHGSVSPQTQQVYEGASATITFVPEEGYAIRSVTVNDEEIPVQGNTVVLKDLQQDARVHGEFARVKAVRYQFKDGQPVDGATPWKLESNPLDQPLGSVMLTDNDGTVYGGSYSVEGCEAFAVQIRYNNANSKSGSALELVYGENSQIIPLPNDCPGWNGESNYKVTTVALNTPIKEQDSIVFRTAQESADNRMGGLICDFWLLCWDDGAQSETFDILLPEESEAGTVTSSPAQKVEKGMNVRFTVTPAEGYQTQAFFVNDQQIQPQADGTYLVENVQQTLAVRVEYLHILQEKTFFFKDGQAPEEGSLWPLEGNPLDIPLGSVKLADDSGTLYGGVYTLDSIQANCIEIRYNNANGAPGAAVALSADGAEQQVVAIPNDCPGWNGEANYRTVRYDLEQPITPQTKQLQIVNAGTTGGLLLTFRLLQTETVITQSAALAETKAPEMQAAVAVRAADAQSADNKTETERAAAGLLVQYAQTLSAQEYHSTGWQLAQERMQTLQQLLKDESTQAAQLARTRYLLACALEDLHKKPDVSELQSILDECLEAMENENYTAYSRELLSARVDKVQAADWEISDADELVRYLHEGKQNLVDVSALLEDEAGKITDQGSYPQAEWESYQKALAQLEEGLAYTHLDARDVQMLHQTYQYRLQALRGDDQAPVLETAQLQTDFVTDITAGISWTKAQDNLGQENLRYFVYCADTREKVTGEAMETLAHPLTIGGLADEDSFVVYNLTPDTEYWFGVLVCDQKGNKTYYDPLQVNTQPERPADVTAPEAQNRQIQAQDISTRSLLLAWQKAEDDTTPQTRLQYNVYMSQDPQEVKDISSMLEHAQLMNDAPLYDAEQFNVSGLHRAQTYYFNIIVQDEAGNRTAYSPVEVTTTQEPTFPDTQTPTVRDDTIRTKKQHSTGVTLYWTKATDNSCEDEELTYYVYRCKEDGNEDDVRGMEALLDPTRAILQNPGGTKDIDHLEITGLTPGKLYWYNIIVEDTAGNKTTYSMASAYARDPQQYTITVSAGQGGTVDPGTSRVNEGEDAVFTVRPNDGWKVESAMLDGNQIPVQDGQIVIQNVRADHLLEVVFCEKEEPEPELQVVFDVDGVQNRVYVKAGEVLKAPADPQKPGFVFDGWYTADGTKYDFAKPVDTAFTLYARFTKKPVEPVDPDNPQQPGQNDNSQSAEAMPQTGDTFGLTGCVLLFTASAAAAGIVKSRKKEERM